MAKAKPTKPVTRKIVPVRGRVAILPRAQETVTPGGVVLPDSAAFSDEPVVGTVTAVGPDCSQIKAGDEVVYSAYAQSVKIDGTEFVLVNESDILAVLQ